MRGVAAGMFWSATSCYWKHGSNPQAEMRVASSMVARDSRVA
jgi:hypothetical protein